MVSKEFVTAGKAIFTVEMPEEFCKQHNLPAHYTFKVNHKQASMQFPEAWFVSILTGPDNTSSYSYLGMLCAHDGSVTLTKKSKYTEDTMPVRLIRRVLSRLWANEGHAIEAAGFKVHHEGKCGRCGRTLTVPESIENGIGPECIKHL